MNDATVLLDTFVSMVPESKSVRGIIMCGMYVTIVRWNYKVLRNTALRQNNEIILQCSRNASFSRRVYYVYIVNYFYELSDSALFLLLLNGEMVAQI